MTRSSIENNRAIPDLINKLRLEHSVTGNLDTAQEIEDLYEQLYINNLYHYGRKLFTSESFQGSGG